MTLTNLDLLKQALLLAHTAPSNRVDAAVELAEEGILLKYSIELMLRTEYNNIIT